MVTSEVIGDGLQVGVSDTLEHYSPEDYWQFFVRRLKSSVAIRGSSNDDGDVNGNGKKAIDLVWQNNNFARASHYFVHFFAVTAWQRRKNAKFDVLWKTWTHDNDFRFLFLNFDKDF